MVHARSLFAAGCLLLLLSGCTQTPTTPSTPAPTGATGGEFEENFDALVDGQRPARWDVSHGTWGARSNITDTVHPKVMRGAGEDPPGLSSLVAPDGYQSVEAFVKFKMISGDAGAGLVLNWQDDQNYVIVRYSIRELDWHLFTMVKGNRQKQDMASVGKNYTHPDLGQWVKMRVTNEAGHVEAFQDTTQVISYDLGSDASHWGRIGLFVRGDIVADFDDLEVEPS